MTEFLNAGKELTRVTHVPNSLHVLEALDQIRFILT